MKLISASFRVFVNILVEFVKDFAHIAVPLLDQLNNLEFLSISVWQCFQTSYILLSSVTLKLPDRHGRFIVSCDVSDRAVGFVLEQSVASGSRRPVTFFSPFLLGRDFDLFTDHEFLKCLLNRTKEHSALLYRWVAKFREFQWKVCHIAWSKNTVADALIRVRLVEAVAQEAGSLDFVKKQQDSCPTLSQIKSLLVSKASPSWPTWSAGFR